VPALRAHTTAELRDALARAHDHRQGPVLIEMRLA
jgi:hypothetical protein